MTVKEYTWAGNANSPSWPTIYVTKADYDALARELAECRKNNFDAAVLILEKRALEAALGKAVDTFEDIATVSRLLGKPLVAESARIASVHCRQALATAETSCDACEGSGESVVNFPDGTEASTKTPPCEKCGGSGLNRGTKP